MTAWEFTSLYYVLHYILLLRLTVLCGMSCSLSRPKYSKSKCYVKNTKIFTTSLYRYNYEDAGVISSLRISFILIPIVNWTGKPAIWYDPTRRCPLKDRGALLPAWQPLESVTADYECTKIIVEVLTSL